MVVEACRDVMDSLNGLAFENVRYTTFQASDIVKIRKFRKYREHHHDKLVIVGLLKNQRNVPSRTSILRPTIFDSGPGYKYVA